MDNMTHDARHAIGIVHEKGGLMGLLNELMDRQETYRVMLRELREEPDKSFADALTAAPGLEEENVIAVAVILFELEERGDPDRQPQGNDILWAIEFLDHLDTLGKEVRNKYDESSIVVPVGQGHSGSN
jgi:hypothetical protein